MVDFLEKYCKTDIYTLDRKVYLGFNERYECRMLAIRVPDSVAAVRRGKLKSEAKKKGNDWLVIKANRGRFYSDKRRTHY